MNKKAIAGALAAAVAVVFLGSVNVRSAADAYPGACVDCHVKGADSDLRLSVLMTEMVKAANPKMLAAVQAASPKGLKLKGKHPNVAAMMKSTPDGCKKCHTATSKVAPSMSALSHVIHLAPDSKFLAGAGNSCTSCHKMDVATGAVTIPSGPEK